MSSYELGSQDINFPVCRMTVNGSIISGRLSGMAHYYKTTSCCGKLKAVHHKCAMFLSKIDSIYKFNTPIYEDNQKIKLLFMKCNIM